MSTKIVIVGAGKAVLPLMYDVIDAQKRRNISNTEELSSEFDNLGKRLNSAVEGTDLSANKVNEVLLL